jgi:hypothetical protein
MSEFRGDLALAAALKVMAPLVEYLLREGVTYPQLSQALKGSFLDAAATTLSSGGHKLNDSSVSTLSGVHRKDVREWRLVGQLKAPARGISTAAEVYTRWVSDPAYRDPQGRPMALARNGAAPSFESLALLISRDVHSHSLLREMLRLGVARLEEDASGGEQVVVNADGFVPRQGSEEMLQLFADNARDHLASATHNLVGGEPPMLEQSVFADGLCADSAEALGQLARRLWDSAFREMAREATVLNQRDESLPDADQRIRFGIYFHQSDVDKT